VGGRDREQPLCCLAWSQAELWVLGERIDGSIDQSIRGLPPHSLFSSSCSSPAQVKFAPASSSPSVLVSRPLAAATAADVGCLKHRHAAYSAVRSRPSFLTGFVFRGSVLAHSGAGWPQEERYNRRFVLKDGRTVSYSVAVFLFLVSAKLREA